jgi:EAL and modified HD-GYP domain-containing signal transduction protein
MESAHDQVFLARQPIFDRQRRVFGYELLFRAPHQGLGAHEGVAMTLDEEGAAVISEAVLAFGLDTLTHGHPAFMKVSRGVLLGGLPSALPAHQVVIELPDDIDASAEVREACADLRRKGYRIALDHFTPREDIAPLVPFADYLKTDVTSLTEVAQRPLVELRSLKPPVMVATRVQTSEDFVSATRLGCVSFQGDFIGRPVMRVTKDIPANRMHYLRLFRALQNPDISPKELEELIKPDASLVYRVLRAVNSASFAQHSRVDSLRQALVLLGCGTVRQGPWRCRRSVRARRMNSCDVDAARSHVRAWQPRPTANSATAFCLALPLLDAIRSADANRLSHLPLPKKRRSRCVDTTHGAPLSRSLPASTANGISACRS